MKKQLSAVALIIILGQGVKAFGQSDYGDGSQRQTGAYQEIYNATDSKFEPSDSWQYEYNQLGKETRMVALGYSGVSKLWDPWFVKVTTYNANGYKTSETDSNLNPGQFGYRKRTEFKLDGSGRETERTVYSWNTVNSVWETAYRYKTSYNGAGERDTVITERYDANTSKFGFYQKEWYTYDASKQVIEIRIQGWNSTDSKWTDMEKITKTYTAGGNVATYQNQKMHFITKEWVNDYRVEYDFNSEEKMQSVKGYSWDNTAKVWTYSSRENYVYSANSYYTVSEIYDNTAKVWVGTWKYNYTLLPKGWPAEILIQQWDKNTSAWVNKSKRGWDYNTHGYGVYTLGSAWDANASKWKFSGRAWHYFENYSGLDDLSDAAISFYPVPAKDKLNITLNQSLNARAFIQITEISGKEAAAFYCEFNNGTAGLNIENLHLKPGVYFCNLMVEGRIVAKQIQIQ